MDMKNCLSAPTKTTAGGKEKRIISEKQLDEVWFLFAYFLGMDFFIMDVCVFLFSDFFNILWVLTLAGLGQTERQLGKV